MNAQRIAILRKMLVEEMINNKASSIENDELYRILHPDKPKLLWIADRWRKENYYDMLLNCVVK